MLVIATSKFADCNPTAAAVAVTNPVLVLVDQSTSAFISVLNAVTTVALV